MAEMVPDSLPGGRSVGEERLFDVLKRLPDDCVVYYESGDADNHPAFVVICPDLGLAVIKHAGWRASQIATADEARIGLAGPPPSTELNPVTEARDYLESLALGCQREPGFKLLLRSDGGAGSRFLFPVGYGAALMHDSLQQLREEAKTLGDSTLAADLKAIQLRVRRKCNRPKPDSR